MVSFDLKEAAEFLKVHPETLRKMAVSRAIPSCKIGKRWVFLRDQLVEHISNEYANRRGSLRLVDNSKLQENKKCRSTKDMGITTSTLSTQVGKEYANLLKLPTNPKRKNCMTG